MALSMSTRKVLNTAALRSYNNHAWDSYWCRKNGMGGAKCCPAKCGQCGSGGSSGGKCKIDAAAIQAIPILSTARIIAREAELTQRTLTEGRARRDSACRRTVVRGTPFD